jgi:hypothetical protein
MTDYRPLTEDEFTYDGNLNAYDVRSAVEGLREELAEKGLLPYCHDSIDRWFPVFNDEEEVQK